MELSHRIRASMNCLIWIQILEKNSELYPKFSEKLVNFVQNGWDCSSMHREIEFSKHFLLKNTGFALKKEA